MKTTLGVLLLFSKFCTAAVIYDVVPEDGNAQFNSQAAQSFRTPVSFPNNESYLSNVRFRQAFSGSAIPNGTPYQLELYRSNNNDATVFNPVNLTLVAASLNQDVVNYGDFNYFNFDFDSNTVKLDTDQAYFLGFKNMNTNTSFATFRVQVTVDSPYTAGRVFSTNTSFDFSSWDVGGTITTVVPEASTGILAGFGTLCLLRRRRA